MTAATSYKNNKDYLFLLLIFSVTFLLYYPAASAGWVYDTTGWLTNVRHEGFSDFLNRSESGIPSLYHFTQLITYCYYHIFGANAWAWHLLMVGIHSCNAYLLYRLCSRLFSDSGMANARAIAIGGALLFTVCPHISESIVWEAAIHYLLGFLYLMLILNWVQQYHYQQRQKYVWLAGILFFLSSYSLEVFYLTPGFVISLALYYWLVLRYKKELFTKVLKFFLIPQLVIFALHFLVLYSVYHRFAHIADGIIQPLQNYLVKPPKYLFHIFFLGRYFSVSDRLNFYHYFDSLMVLILFYSACLLGIAVLCLRFKKMQPKSKAVLLLMLWTGFSLFIISPLIFPDLLLVFYDRYTYMLDAFALMLLVVLFSSLPGKYTGGLIMLAYTMVNVYFTMKVNNYWLQSASIEQQLYDHLPDPGNKTILLLNIPENLVGVPMIGAEPESEYKNLRQLLTGRTIKNEIYDVVSYNMQDDGDGVNVIVKNDSTLRVTLNNWGGWWQYGRHGCVGYETKEYAMKTDGRSYDLTLRHPAENYLLLYQVGDHWKIVDMKVRNQVMY